MGKAVNMPELPEVETVMQGLIPFLLNRQIVELDIRSPKLRIPIPHQKLKKLLGNPILSLKRRAKYILIDFKNGQTLVVHLGMTGSFTVMPPKRHHEIELDRHDHLLLTTDKNVKIIFRDPRRFGMVDVIKSDERSIYKPLQSLGVEPLDTGFTMLVLKEKLSTRTIAIKPAIMDQSVVVGVGNIYASEALFLSGINPMTPANQINDKKLSLLVENIKFILSAAIKSGGSTLRDYRRVGGETGYFQFHFAVYDKAGEACPNCTCNLTKTGGIQKIVQAGRSTFYCGMKQK